jgi:hypothetical protein
VLVLGLGGGGCGFFQAATASLSLSCSAEGPNTRVNISSRYALHCKTQRGQSGCVSVTDVWVWAALWVGGAWEAWGEGAVAATASLSFSCSAEGPNTRVNISSRYALQRGWGGGGWGGGASKRGA